MSDNDYIEELLQLQALSLEELKADIVKKRKSKSPFTKNLDYLKTITLSEVLDDTITSAEKSVELAVEAATADVVRNNDSRLSDARAPIISGLTAETSIADDDLIPIYDTSASANRKMTKANFVSGLVVGGSEYITRTIEGVVYESTLMYWVCPATATISSAAMYLGSSPSASTTYCKVQVMKNGLLETNSVFTSDAAMQVTESTSATNGVYPATGTLDSGQTSLAAGDVLWVRVNQADAGSADLVVRVKVTYS